MFVVNKCLTRAPRIHKGEWEISSANSSGETGYPHAKSWNWTRYA